MKKNINKRRRKGKRHRRIFRILVILTAVLLTAGILWRMYEWSREGIRTGTESGEPERAYRRITVDGVDYQYNTDLITILLLGIDARDGGMSGQSDAISLLVFDRGEERMRVIGISRDSMVPIRVFDVAGNDLGLDTQHLALAYAYGTNPDKGCLLAQEAVSDMFHGIPIIYYGAASLSALPDFQNIIGEITVRIPDDSLEFKDDDLKEGELLTLDSENVEEFVRTRDIETEFSNSGRMRRQRIYVEAYLEKLKTLLKEDFSGTVSRMEDVFSSTVTNISLNEISSFAEMALSYSFDPDEDYYIVQGTDQEGAYHDEFLVDEDALQQLVLQIFYRKK